jgi:hypothetical protein
MGLLFGGIFKYHRRRYHQMPLSDLSVKAAKAKNKPYKLTDEKGLHLLVDTNGSKYFRFKYRFDGKQKTLAIGVYPATTLK